MMQQPDRKITIPVPTTLGMICFTASFLSYLVNKSVLWAILHFILGPGYIPYWFIFKTDFFSRLVAG